MNKLLGNMHMHDDDKKKFTIETTKSLNQSRENTNFVINDIPRLHGKIGQDKILKFINTYLPIMSSEG